jgi:hypothetical protein
MGATKLSQEPINLTYVPKDGGRRIHVYAVDEQTRIEAIEEYKEYYAYCDSCYALWKMGDYSIEWFIPPKLKRRRAVRGFPTSPARLGLTGSYSAGAKAN